MGKWYFTCGQIHRHELADGKIWDKNSVIVVEAETEQYATDFVFDVFGRLWSGIYDDFENIEKYYKNGIVHTYKV